MTVDPPRRLRPRAAQRNKTITTQTKGAPSAKGSTAAARPVATKRNAQQYVPPSTERVITGASGGINSTSISSTTAGVGASSAGGDGGTALGTDKDGSGAYAGGDNSCAVGGGATATHNYGGAVGADTFAGGLGTWAIGTDSSGAGAAESTADVIKLGTAMHTTVITGALVISDGSTKYRLDATGGVLTLVAYP